jgi:methyl-accepting chemotaxis protein
MLPRSIKAKLVSLGLLLIFLPLLIVGFFSVTKSSDSLLDLATEKSRTMAQDIATLIANVMEIEKTTAKILSADQVLINALTSPQETDSVEKHCNRIFSLINNNSKFQGIFIADRSGQIIGGILDSGKEYDKVSVANNPAFLLAKQNGDVVIGRMIRSEATSRIVLPIWLQ